MDDIIAPMKMRHQLPGPGEVVFQEAEVVGYSARFSEITTNPNYGGASDLGTRTLDQLVAGDIPAGHHGVIAPGLVAAVKRAIHDSQLLVAIKAGHGSTVRRWLALGATASAPIEPKFEPMVAGCAEDPIDFSLWQLELEIDGAKGPSDKPDKRDKHLVWARRIAAHLVDVVGALDLQNLEVARRFVSTVRTRRVKPMQVVRPPTEKSKTIGALTELLMAVRSIGDANDAFDRGYSEAADRLYGGAPRHAREAWALAPASLATLLPDIADVMSTGEFETTRWNYYADLIAAALARARA